MIQRIQTVSFGNSPVREIKNEIKKAKETKEQLVEGAIGATGAVAVAKGNQVYRAVAGVTKKTVKIASDVPTNSKSFQKFFLNIFESMKTVKGLGWVAKIAKNPAVRGISKVFGGVTAVGFCVTDFSNMINTGAKIFDGEKFPTLSGLGK